MVSTHSFSTVTEWEENGIWNKKGPKSLPLLIIEGVSLPSYNLTHLPTLVRLPRIFFTPTYFLLPHVCFSF